MTTTMTATLNMNPMSMNVAIGGRRYYCDQTFTTELICGDSMIVSRTEIMAIDPDGHRRLVDDIMCILIDVPTPADRIADVAAVFDVIVEDLHNERMDTTDP